MADQGRGRRVQHSTTSPPSKSAPHKREGFKHQQDHQQQPHEPARVQLALPPQDEYKIAAKGKRLDET
ncbi:hypothetical protein RHGRI_032134 [Rhododendron griersonianum]|uniref:Uncharacterized protein n=1 Tax=Rhododendron griersonianum TaxID=479676 RepID=A0AAV6IAQ8_9ERIC|nr:hypothetical protein RHGRI_032134 [Rhododendron griersonianum]